MSFETPKCASCHRELPERGAILYGPPEVQLGLSELCVKWHVCKLCYEHIVATFPQAPHAAREENGFSTERPPALVTEPL